MNMGPIRSAHRFRPGKPGGSTRARVEKACGVRALPDEENSNQNPQMESVAASLRVAPSHSGTNSDAPFRYINSLDSAFVAQVLGQVLMGGCNRETPRYVSLRLFPASALLLDEKI
jgi:hypothetical protein